MEKEFGKKIRALRRACDYTQEEIAEAIGVTSSYLSQVESGSKGPLSTPQISKFVERIGKPGMLFELCYLAAFQAKKVEIDIKGHSSNQIHCLVRIKLSHEGYEHC